MISKEQADRQVVIKIVGEYRINLSIILGQGNFGTVHLATRSDNNKYYCAVKVIPINAQNNPLQKKDSDLNRELDILKKIKHENLLQLIEIQQSTNNLYIFIEYCQGGTMTNYIKDKNGLDEQEALNFLNQIVQGYKQLYEYKIIHRDLKTDNLLLSHGVLKIADFGFGRFVEDMDQATHMSLKFTPIYGSPQILQREKYSSKTDIWSLGVIFYFMIYKDYPFMAHSQEELVRVIKENTQNKVYQIRDKSQKKISQKAYELLNACLQYHEADRISWEELFKHPLLNEQMNYGNLLELNDNNSIYDDTAVSKSILRVKKNLGNVQVENNKVQVKKKIFENNKLNEFEKKNNLNFNKEILQNDKELYSAVQIEEEKNQVTKIYNYLLLLRNKAYFASVILPLFFESRIQLKTENYVYKSILYCTGGYYYYQIIYIREVLNGQKEDPYIKEEGLNIDVFRKSDKFELFSNKLKQDEEMTQEFFPLLQQTIVSEIEQEIQNYSKNIAQNQQDANVLKEMNELVKFTSMKNKNHPLYSSFIAPFLKRLLEKQNLTTLSKEVLKCLYALLVFQKIEIIIKQEKNFDFAKFYSDNINSSNSEKLIEYIESLKKQFN